MLTPGPGPGFKLKLNISSFLKVVQPLDCHVCVKYIIFIVLSLQMMGEWEGWGGDSFM